MDFIDIILGQASVWTKIIGAVILLVLYRVGVFSGRGTPARTNEKHITCESPNCVRCQTYTANSVEVLCQRWSDYKRETLQASGGIARVERITRTMSKYGHVKTRGQDPLQSTFELLDLQTTPFHDRKLFVSDVALLEAKWEAIYSEFQEVKQDCHLWKINSTPSGRWSAFYLINQGAEIRECIARCPKTYGILLELRSLMSDCIFGNACFSVVHPETHITEHYGPCNIRVRCHLGLDVPNGCELFVNGEKRKWTRGKCILFDDSYLHYVTHHGSDETSRPRVVFLVDFWHPDISEAERHGLGYLLNSSNLTSESTLSL